MDRTEQYASYASKPSVYFAGARRDYVEALPNSALASILEIGCANGATGALALATGKCARYCGIESYEAAFLEAKTRLSEVLAGNVETLSLPWPPHSFDVLIASEVLEHLVDPWATLQRLAELIRPGGLVFASSPNVSHHRIIRALLLGQWDLADSGPMDRTHLRWFTPTSFRQMFEEAGFVVETCGPVVPFNQRSKIFNLLTGNRFQHLFMTQINLFGRKI